MGKYIHLFETEGGFNTVYNGEGYKEPWVSLTREIERVNYNKSEDEKLLETPLTFEITGDGDIVWKASRTELTKTIEYKKNDGEWTSITSNIDALAPSITVAAGDTLQFRGNNTAYGASSYNTFSGSTAQFKVKGNIMSLIDSTNFGGLTTLESDNTFIYLFKSCTGLTDASKLLLPATTLANYCYYFMFADCTSLTTAPELPATTLKLWCYTNMFTDCTNLNYIKCLATDISAYQSTGYWVGGVAPTGTFVTPSTTAWTTGNNGIPANWTRVDA